jgi:hypothetical protein
VTDYKNDGYSTSPDRKVPFESAEDARRKFLTKFLVAGAGALLYSVPSVKAFAQSGARVPRPKAFQIMLPATYEFSGDNAVLNITRARSKTTAVQFDLRGRVRLTASGKADIANVEMLSLEAVSVDANPIPTEGGRGRITATARNGRGGQLNLQTGRVTESSLSLAVSYSDERSGAAGETRFAGQIRLPGSGSGGQQGFMDSCLSCFNGNTVSAKIKTPKGDSTVNGKADVHLQLLR